MPSNEYVFGSAYDRYVDFSANYFANINNVRPSVEPIEIEIESPPERKMPNVIPYLVKWIDGNAYVSDVCKRWKNEFKEDPPAFLSENREAYMQEVIQSTLLAYPALSEYLMVCVNCGLYRNKHNFATCIMHVRDGFDVGTSTEVCHNCQGGMYTWRDGTHHNMREPRLTRYHGNDRGRFYRGVDFQDPTLIGLELEVFIKGDRRHVISSALNLQDKYPIVLAEEDNSLDRANGAEFVFKPMPFSLLTSRDSPVKKVVEEMKSFGTLGWDAGVNYGVHLNMNALEMTRLHCAKFCYFVNKNNDLCEVVGGRPESRYQEYLATRLSKHEDISDNKYQAAVRRSEARIEIRIFRSSLMWQRLRRYFEFADSVRCYTKLASARELSSPTAYIEFMRQQTNKYYREMRNLLGLNKNKRFPSKEHAFSVEE